jgi:hypothetical protein
MGQSLQKSKEKYNASPQERLFVLDFLDLFARGAFRSGLQGFLPLGPGPLKAAQFFFLLLLLAGNFFPAFVAFVESGMFPHGGLLRVKSFSIYYLFLG